MLLPWRIASVLATTALVLSATRHAQAQAQVLTRVVGGAAAAAPYVDRDPGDPQERFLLLTPGGPIIVQCTLTYNGQPFRMERDKFIRGILDQLEKNDQGQPSWEKAVSNPRSPLRRTVLRQNVGSVESFIKGVDTNSDGLIDRAELCRLVVRNSRDDFNLTTNLYGAPTAPKLLELLDTNSDQTLSAEETASAPERLKSRDQDDNDLLTAVELGGQGFGMYRIARANGQTQGGQLALLLGPAADFSLVFKSLHDKYRDTDGKLRAACFPLLPQLVEQLDTDRNGELERSEVEGLNTISPHLICEAPLVNTTARQAIRVKVAAAEWESTAKVDASADNRVAIHLASLVVTFALSPASTTPIADYGTTARSVIDRADKDKNGYLEASEVQGPGGFGTMFDNWDLDGDGKVYATEIATYMEQQAALTQMQFNAVVADQGSPLFATIDESGDGRLGLREIRGAAERLLKFDANRDGQIAPSEVPRQFSLTIGRGFSAGRGDVAAFTSYAAGQSAAPNKSDWFASMDRNGDGDISRREFLGALEQFDKLDANHDSLVSRSEAGADK